MIALLLIAHGSRRTESNQEIAALTERVAALATDRFDMVEHAFLELAPPSIPDGIERCIERGAKRVCVLPYFLARGTHVAEDIPAIVDGARAKRPDVDIVVTDYLGTADALPQLLLQLASAPGERHGHGDADRPASSLADAQMSNESTDSRSPVAIASTDGR